MSPEKGGGNFYPLHLLRSRAIANKGNIGYTNQLKEGNVLVFLQYTTTWIHGTCCKSGSQV